MTGIIPNPFDTSRKLPCRTQTWNQIQVWMAWISSAGCAPSGATRNAMSIPTGQTHRRPGPARGYILHRGTSQNQVRQDHAPLAARHRRRPHPRRHHHPGGCHDRGAVETDLRRTLRRQRLMNGINVILNHCNIQMRNFSMFLSQ